MSKKTTNDEEKWCISPWGCLSSVLSDYNIDHSHITWKMGEHMVEDFMKCMENAGYVTESEDKTE